MVRSKNKDMDLVKWTNSTAKKILKEDIIAGTVTTLMSASEIFLMRPVQ